MYRKNLPDPQKKDGDVVTIKEKKRKNQKTKREYQSMREDSAGSLEHDAGRSRIDCKNRLFGGNTLKDYIEERVLNVAEYIVEHGATVRDAAKKFGISKSTVHKDVTDRLAQISPPLAAQARVVLDVNKSERHIRGGMATKEKYLHQHG